MTHSPQDEVVDAIAAHDKATLVQYVRQAWFDRLAHVELELANLQIIGAERRMDASRQKSARHRQEMDELTGDMSLEGIGRYVRAMQDEERNSAAWNRAFADLRKARARRLDLLKKGAT